MLLAVIQIKNTTGVLFLLFLLLYWHVLSPHLILSVKSLKSLKSLNEVCKQTTFRNVKRDNGCRENKVIVNECSLPLCMSIEGLDVARGVVRTNIQWSCFTTAVFSLSIPESRLFADFFERFKNDMCFHE